MILVLSFLFKGESFSFVRGLWLLDLDNRNIFLVEIFWISFASDVLRWWLENLLLPSIWVFVVRSIFFGNIVLSTGGQLQLGHFCRGSSTRLDWMRLYQGLSLVSLRSMISSCYFSVAFVLFSWRNKFDMVDVCCVGERVQWLPWANRFT